MHIRNTQCLARKRGHERVFAYALKTLKNVTGIYLGNDVTA